MPSACGAELISFSGVTTSRDKFADECTVSRSLTLLVREKEEQIAPRPRQNSVDSVESHPRFGMSSLFAWECALPRAYWNGFLKLSLVSCPVALYPATTAAERVSFRQVNRRTGHRLKH